MQTIFRSLYNWGKSFDFHFNFRFEWIEVVIVCFNGDGTQLTAAAQREMRHSNWWVNFIGQIFWKNIFFANQNVSSGGKDKLGNILIQFPFDSQLDRISSDELQNVILYLASIPSSKKNFVFVVDMRGRKYESVKPILKILQNLQVCWILIELPKYCVTLLVFCRRIMTITFIMCL